MPPTSEEKNSAGLSALFGLGLVSSGLYLWVTSLSSKFEYNNDLASRPIPLVLSILATAFVLYLVSVWFARRARQGSGLLTTIIVFAVVFRAIIFFSTPIQEVDIYRYVWDGAVTTQGISPFRYPPGVIESAIVTPTDDPDLQKLAERCQRDPALKEVLGRVHYDHLPTVYPTTSQAVFALSELSTPAHSDLVTRVRIMKGWLIAFDLATLILVIRLLMVCQMPIGLSLLYAWCPLVIKEISNSGHLDTIAVFLATLAVFLLVRCCESAKALTKKGNPKNPWLHWGLCLSSLALASGVGAKLFPVVLVPLFCFVAAKNCGWKSVFVPAVLFAAMTTALFWPMLPERTAQVLESNPKVTMQEQQTSDPLKGMVKFLKSWEMNDLLFMIVVENLKPSESFASNKSVWFSLAPDAWRCKISDWTTKTFSVTKEEAPFFATRLATSLIFLALAFWLAWLASRRSDLAFICETAFLTIAWFWLLSPTQNPWYWVWALPFLPFVRNRAWLMIGGLLLLYYLRFWLSYNYAESEILGTGYKGVAFFDFVITWLEFGTFLVWLVCEWLFRVCRKETNSASSEALDSI